MELPPPAKGSALLPFPAPPPLKAVLLDVELPMSLVGAAAGYCWVVVCTWVVPGWGDGLATCAAEARCRGVRRRRNRPCQPTLHTARRPRCGWRCSMAPPRCSQTSTSSWETWTSPSRPGASKVGGRDWLACGRWGGDAGAATFAPATQHAPRWPPLRRRDAAAGAALHDAAEEPAGAAPGAQHRSVTGSCAAAVMQKRAWLPPWLHFHCTHPA